MECLIDDCTLIPVGRGWCSKHYNRWSRTGDPLGSRRPSRRGCSAEGCSAPVVGQELCERHYDEQVRKPAKKARLLASKVDRTCAQCGTALEPARPKGAVFCNRNCKAAFFRSTDQGREKARRYHFLKRYGLTMEQVDAMRARGCEICGDPGGTGRGGQLHIDHCHRTGVVRGVLCTNCNNGIGKLRDDPALLRKAVEYLERDRS